MIDYKSSGVDIDSGNRAVELMKEHVKKTYTNGVFGDIGLFSGGFSLREFKDYKDPILLASTDGVGTKLLIAQKMNKHDTVGIDLVAMCVNDLICQGAKPLFFLDYIGIDKLVPEKVEQIVKGISKACMETSSALIGGETAELPGMYSKDEYDLAGFSVGIVDREKIIDGRDIKSGDIVLGLKSSGLHSNGYSLVRKLFFEELGMSVEDKFFDTDMTLGEVLLTPTKLYVKSILELLESVKVCGIANITGGGLYENIPRILPEGLGVNINKNSWDKPLVFDKIVESKKIDDKELYRAFNMGIGMVVIIKEEDLEESIKVLSKYEEVFKIGEVVDGKGVNLL